MGLVQNEAAKAYAAFRASNAFHLSEELVEHKRESRQRQATLRNNCAAEAWSTSPAAMTASLSMWLHRGKKRLVYGSLSRGMSSFLISKL